MCLPASTCVPAGSAEGAAALGGVDAGCILGQEDERCADVVVHGPRQDDDECNERERGYGGESAAADFAASRWILEEADGADHRAGGHAAARRSRRWRRPGFQVPGIEDAGHTPDDRHDDEGEVDLGGDGIRGEPRSMALRHEGIVVDAEAEDPVGGEVVECVARSLPEVGRFDEVGEDVVAVVAEERVAVDGECVDGRDDHYVEGDEREEAAVGVPPDDRGDRGDHELDEHSGGGDDDSLPFAGEAPGVGHVAVEAGHKGEQHDAELVDFAAEMFAGEGVAQLVQDFDGGDGGDQPEPISHVDEGGELGQAGAEFVEVADDERGRVENDDDGDGERGFREEPAAAVVNGGEEAIGIHAAELNGGQLDERGGGAAEAFLAHAAEELVALAFGVAGEEARFVEPAEERPDFLIGDRARREAAAELAFEFGQAHRLSQQFHQRIFFGREMEVLEA